MPIDFGPTDPSAARIVVAMSGGVDSSVVAALAARTGAEVIGVTLQLYDHGEAVKRTGSCCAGQDIYDAKTVADRLGIAHYVLDYESRFRTGVIDHFADEYAPGRTPVPCSLCNQGVKFIDLIAFARELGADCLATGHYVRRVVNASRVELHKGADPARDQSYFLYGTTAEQLDFLRFPLGDLPKSEVRRLAEEAGLGSRPSPTARTSASSPTAIMPGWSRSCGPRPPRPARSSAWTARARDSMPAWSTSPSASAAGSRSADRRSRSTWSASSPEQRLVVGPRRALAVGDARRGAQLARRGPDRGRRQGPLHGATGRCARSTATGCDFATPEYGVAPGQAAVFYDGSRLLGGGWIAETVAAEDAGPAALRAMA